MKLRNWITLNFTTSAPKKMPIKREKCKPQMRKKHFKTRIS